MINNDCLLHKSERIINLLYDVRPYKVVFTTVDVPVGQYVAPNAFRDTNEERAHGTREQ